MKSDYMFICPQISPEWRGGAWSYQGQCTKLQNEGFRFRRIRIFLHLLTIAFDVGLVHVLFSSRTFAVVVTAGQHNSPSQISEWACNARGLLIGGEKLVHEDITQY